MKKGSVEPATLNSMWTTDAIPAGTPVQHIDHEDAQLTRRDVLETLIENTPPDESIVVGTTGYTGRELFALDDRKNQIYMVGSMGCASSLGLGLSLALPEKKVVVADGDGAALMRMGNLATIGAYGGSNFQHLLLDNAVHESTGGQSTVSSAISFAAVAAACGYHEADEAINREQLKSFLQTADGPAMQHFRIRRGVPSNLPRPDQSPADIRKRLMNHLGISTAWSEL